MASDLPSSDAQGSSLSMTTIFHLRRLAAHARRTVPPASGKAVLFACCLFTSQAGLSAAASSADDVDKPAAAQPAEDDFTRESMAELGRPPAPTPAPVAATARHSYPHARRARPDPKDAVVHHVRFRRREPEESKPQVATQTHARTHSHRNPVASFIYGWNGWVIRTFHTRFGTVLLGTVGAQT